MSPPQSPTRSCVEELGARRFVRRLAGATLLLACSEDPAAPTEAPSVDLRGSWEVRDSSVIRYRDASDGTPVVAMTLRVATYIAGEPEGPIFPLLGTVTDSLCLGECDRFLGVPQRGRDIVYAGSDSLSGPFATIWVPLRAVSDSGIHFRVTDDSDRRCALRYELRNAGPSDRSCLLAVHWRRIAAEP